jgi:catechol 2,3-dioxygenase-like lactoylglutathione lyase family enzyme
MTSVGKSNLSARKKDALGVHSIGEFVLAVPSLGQAEHFYTSFGLNVNTEGGHLSIRAGANSRWGRVIEERRKFLHHISFNCFEEDFPRFRAHLETLGIRRLDPPAGFEDDGLWFRGHDGLLMEIRVGQKTMPDEMSKLEPVPLDEGIRNAPYRRLAGKVELHRLSHILQFTTDLDGAVQFYTRVLGLRLSDRSGPVGFLHAIHGCDHHIVAFLQSEKPGFHHASWIVPSFDAIGLGAMTMADKGYNKGWGTGRHVLGSNYFYYVADPWGSFNEYACGIDYIPASMEWVALEHPGEDSLYLWGPDVPPEFVRNAEAGTA